MLGTFSRQENAESFSYTSDDYDGAEKLLEFLGDFIPPLLGEDINIGFNSRDDLESALRFCSSDLSRLAYITRATSDLARMPKGGLHITYYRCCFLDVIKFSFG